MACYDRAYRIFFAIAAIVCGVSGHAARSVVSCHACLVAAYPSEELSPLTPLAGYSALTPEGQSKMDRYGGEWDDITT